MKSHPINIPTALYKRLAALAKRKGEIIDDLAAELIEEALERR